MIKSHLPLYSAFFYYYYFGSGGEYIIKKDALLVAVNWLGNHLTSGSRVMVGECQILLTGGEPC